MIYLTSAWWISRRAVKAIYDHEDNLVPSPYPTTVVWNLIKSHFSIESRADLLEHCYARFKKPFFAQLCEQLAVAACDGDQLCLHLFEEAGRCLARATVALLPKVSNELTKSGDLSIVCVGSVWKSWHLLRKGFLTEIGTKSFPFGLKLLKLKQHMALGAVYLGVDAIKYDMPRDYTKNYEIFHYYHEKVQNNSVRYTNGNANGLQSKSDESVCA